MRSLDLWLQPTYLDNSLTTSRLLNIIPGRFSSLEVPHSQHNTLGGRSNEVSGRLQTQTRVAACDDIGLAGACLVVYQNR